MSDQVPAPDSSRATPVPSDGVRPIDPIERLPGATARGPGNGSVWGPGTERADAAMPVRAADHVALDPASARQASPRQASGAPSTAPTHVIGRISRVKGSDLWADGAGLAGWLAASPEPLSEVLGKPPFEFASSGSNILLGTSADQHPVCVVCEVGPSSDEGLGILMRVAAIQEGGLVIWVAGEMGDAHVAALSWLNRSTSPRFFLVKVTGIRIDGSASAPIFELVARPARGSAPSASGTPGVNGGAPRPGDAPRRRAEDHAPEA